MKNVQVRKVIDKCSKSVGGLEEMFDDGEYTTEEEFLESYEYIETNPDGYEIWHLKPHIQKQIKDEYGLQKKLQFLVLNWCYVENKNAQIIDFKRFFD